MSESILFSFSGGNMRLEKASHKAIVYACMNFHYAKSVPVNVTGFSVFNDENEWCGVVLFGSGAANNLAMPFGLNQGEVIELVRMALNGKHLITSKVLSLSLKLIKKNLPLCKIIVSYADSEKNHYGTIYQAANFIYVGYSVDTNLVVNGTRKHRRSLGSIYGTSSIEKLKQKGLEIENIITKPKWKYIYPLHKSMIPLCKSLSKPYPKPAELAHKGEHESFQTQGAFDSTIPLKD